MSAFTVSKEHIDSMVYALDLDGKMRDQETRNIIGQILWDENYKSVNARYSGKDEAPKYVFTTPEKPYSLYEAYKNCRCYNYQSCESENYNTTHACVINEVIMTTIERCLEMTKEEIQKMPEYEKADWGI